MKPTTISRRRRLSPQHGSAPPSRDLDRLAHCSAAERLDPVLEFGPLAGVLGVQFLTRWSSGPRSAASLWWGRVRLTCCGSPWSSCVACSAGSVAAGGRVLGFGPVCGLGAWLSDPPGKGVDLAPDDTPPGGAAFGNGSVGQRCMSVFSLVDRRCGFVLVRAGALAYLGPRVGCSGPGDKMIYWVFRGVRPLILWRSFPPVREWGDSLTAGAGRGLHREG